MRKQSTFLLALFLVGCGPVTPIVSTSAHIVTATLISEPAIKFSPPNFLITPEEHSAKLNVGIFALNKKTAFLLGKLSTSLSTQSTLLRSNNEGKTWVEIMKPVAGSSVIDFQMFNSGEGWALIMEFIQHPGEILLFHTMNFGDNWEKIYKFSKPSLDSAPANMTFFDNIHGQVLMYITNSSNDRIAFLTTLDGGLSWQESSNYIPPFNNKKVFRESITELYYQNQKDFSQSWSLDYSSHWKLETTDEKLIIYRQLVNITDNSWDNWEIMNSLPRRYNYQNNQIVIP